MEAWNEARKLLEAVAGKTLLKEYLAILRPLCIFNRSMNIDEFDRKARKLLSNERQIIAHNRILKVLHDTRSSDSIKQTKAIDSTEIPKPKHHSSKVPHDTNGDASKRHLKRGSFHQVEILDHLMPVHSSRPPPNELFMPDYGFISARVALTAKDNGLQCIEANVTDLIINSCQMFVKNILTAMITRKKSYKIRDGKFQYGFNQPIPDPFIRNFSKIVDDTADSKVDVSNDDESFHPRLIASQESMDHQKSIAFSSAKRRKIDNLLTVRLLYDTLKENPSLLGTDATHKLHILKLNLQCDI